ncbi:hypothetical protein AGMMS49960_09690 [Betaproteobacteria bacterium]|nr:hypothetical protein AGMMS49543_13600 [Betaproteobacteria bacterium]GHU00806.1 hypothetical protein AGMMS49960_09690 [Betaproteobacteria bacterium]GHU15838.1 hypothetical protein AGMMS50243_00400 [Betaproteobacteria bacterium]
MKPNRPPSLPHLFVLLLGIMTAMPCVAQSDWERIVGDRERTVEIDPASIFDSYHNTKVAWGRVVLSAAESEKNHYHTIKALNRYDCLNRSFITIKRVYLNVDQNVLKEETVSKPVATVVKRNSVDEQMWRKVCFPTPPAKDAKGTPQAPVPTKGSSSRRIDRLAAAADQAAVNARTPPAAVAPPPAASVAPPPAKGRIKATPAESALTAAPTANTPAAVTRPTVAAEVAPPDGATPAAMPMTPVTAPQPTPAATPAVPASRVTPAPRVTLPAATSSTSPPPSLPPVARRERVRESTPVVFPAPSRTAHVRPASATPKTPLIGNDDWRYNGPAGPEQWGKLRPDWRLCGEGLRQSPIDLGTSGAIAVDLDPVSFDYRTTSFRITDTGNLLRVAVGEGMEIEVRGRKYALTGITLHSPGEARFNGERAELEVHFAHHDRDGRQAFVAVQAKRGEQSNPMLQTLLNNLPLEQYDSYTPPTAQLDLAAFLPTNSAHFLYMGSLSAPPCSEEVLWIVMKEPVILSAEQLDVFTGLHPGNARPTQAANGRTVLESR